MGQGIERGIERDRHLAALMDAAQGGDQASYLRLLNEVTPLLRRIVVRRRRGIRRPDAEDLVQDILLSLHAARATYDPSRPFLPWLMAIARNRMADGARRHARRDANELPVACYPETLFASAANKEAEPYGDPQALRAALLGLPRGQKEAVEMLKLKELTLKEAATLSGTTVGALKVAVHRGMKALRAVLSKDGGGAR